MHLVTVGSVALLQYSYLDDRMVTVAPYTSVEILQLVVYV